jgi:PA14 domain
MEYEVASNYKPDEISDNSKETGIEQQGTGENAAFTSNDTTKPYIESSGQSTIHYTKGKAERDETYAIHSGIGDNDDLFVKAPAKEELEIPFQYAARYRGKKKHQTMIYPEIPFEYGVHYSGELLVNDNEAPFKNRVDAYPGKTIEFDVTETKPHPSTKKWAAELEFLSKLPPVNYGYAVEWTGEYMVEDKGDVKQLFTSNSGQGSYVGKGDVSRWKYNSNGYVYETLNDSYFSGVITNSYWNWVSYEAEFDFKPILTRKNNVASGRDDDYVGIIFKAKDKRNFWMFLWEGDDHVSGSLRAPNNLDGYDIFTDRKGTQSWDDICVRSTSTSGWGAHHQRVYEVVNGKMYRRSATNFGDQRGWKLNEFNGIKIETTGSVVEMFIRYGKTGNWTKALQIDTGRDKGSFGMINISQAVEFHGVRVRKWNQMKGRVPESGFTQTDHIGTVQVATSGKAHVASQAAAKAGGKPYKVLSVKGLEDPDSKANGTMSLSVDGAVKVSTINGPKAGEFNKVILKRYGETFITPLNVNPMTSVTVFSSMDDAFGELLAEWQAKYPEYEISNKVMKVVEPDGNDRDWDFENNRFTVWNSTPKIDVTTKRFTRTVYAYQGWQKNVDLVSEFNSNEWSTYELNVQEQTLNPDYDEIMIQDRFIHMRTTEWYKGTYPADIKDEGVVTNEEDILISIPPMPEHYVDPKTNEVMYHGYEDVHFLLTQLLPEETNEVTMWFESRPNTTTGNSTILNAIDGKPVVYTYLINDKVVVNIIDKPHKIPWTSGKYIGYGKVNGKRPFFKDGAGKKDITGVSTEVVFIPENITRKDGPFIDVNDSRIKYQLSPNKKTVTFTSDFKDAYIWYTDWYTEWKDSAEFFKAKLGEITNISAPVELNPLDDPYYNKDNTIIEKIEVTSSNPFIDLWVEEDEGDTKGFHGTYYKYPQGAQVFSESFQVTGDYHERIQTYQIKSYMTSVQIEIKETEPFRIVHVKQDSVTIPEDGTNGWTIVGNTVQIHGTYIKASNIEIVYSIGDFSNEFVLQNEVGDGVKVYVKGVELLTSSYSIVDGILTISNDLLFLNDWVHIKSYKFTEAFNIIQDTYLGEYVGTRIDPEIWFNWGYGSPFPLEVSPFSMMAALSDTINFKYNLDMEVVYPTSEQIDISNFTGEWQQWDQDPNLVNNDGPGDWHGPPDPNYPEVTNLRNQSLRSGWFNPSHQFDANYGFSFNVQARGGDDDMYGAMFRFDQATQNFYSFEWDAFWSINSGGTGVKGMTVFKNICSNPQDAGIAKLNYTKTPLAHLDESWKANQSEIHKIEVNVIDNQIKVWIDDVLKFDVADSTNPFLVGAWGPLTQSQPSTYFWDFTMKRYRKVTHLEDPTFRVANEETLNRPTIVNQPNIEVEVDELDLHTYFGDILGNHITANGVNGEEILSIKYLITTDTSDYPVYFNVNDSTITQDEMAKVYSTVVGKEGPQPDPTDKPIGDQPEPTTPPLIPPTQGNPNDGFSVSWRGYIYAPKTGYYDFQVTVNDGFKLWVDNHLIINEWHLSMFNTYKGTIYLEAGKWYPIKANFFENVGQALVWLQWKIPGDALTCIDPSYVSPYLGYKVKARVKEDTPLPWHPLVHNGYYYFKDKEHYLFAEKIHHIKRAGIDIVDRKVDIHPRPQQGSAILVRDREGTVLRKVTFYDGDWNLTLENTEEFNGNGNSKYYLGYKDIDRATLKIYVNGQEELNFIWNQEESNFQLMRPIHFDETISVTYILLYSYYVDMNHDVENDKARIYLHEAEDPSTLDTLEVIYEGHYTSPFYRATETIFNPLLNHNHRGFLYITDKTEQHPASVVANVSPKRLANTGNRKVLVTVKVDDKYNNPVPLKDVVIKRDGVQVHTGKTNEAGEVYFYDKPVVPSGLVSVYEMSCENIKDICLLNFFTNNKKKRNFVELKTTKAAIKALTDDQVTIEATLRDDDWAVMAGKSIKFSYVDTIGVDHEFTRTTNTNGKASLQLSGAFEQTGEILVKVSYNMGDEETVNFMYIKVIGG